MRTLLVLGIILLVLVLLGQIRLGVAAEYSAQGPLVQLRFGSVRKQVYPPVPAKKAKKPGKKTPDAKPAPKEPSDATLGEKLGGGLDYARSLLPVILEAAGQFKRRLQIDLLRLRLTAGGTDPADAAMLYGYASAALGMLWEPLTSAFNVKDGKAKIDLNFDEPRMVLYAHASLSLKLCQILWLALHFGWKGLRAFLSVRAQHKKQLQHRKAV